MPRAGLAILLLWGSVAHAQAPRDEAPADRDPDSWPEESMPRPLTEDDVENGPYNERVDPLAQRFAVGIALGAYAIQPAGLVADDITEFQTAEVSGRFRATARLDLELVLAAGTEVADRRRGEDRALVSATVGARYRFRPDRAWSWWISGGVGATVIENEMSRARRRHAVVGLGVEKRWGAYGVLLDLRLSRLGPPDERVKTRDPIEAADELTAAQLAVGAGYYF